MCLKTVIHGVIAQHYLLCAFNIVSLENNNVYSLVENNDNVSLDNNNVFSNGVSVVKYTFGSKTVI